MNLKDIREEIDREPFQPLRLYLRSGNTVDVRRAGIAWVMARTVLILNDGHDNKRKVLYSVIAASGIERIDRLP